MTKRTTFNADFKYQAIQLAQWPEITLTQAAHDLGIGASTLHRWIREARESGSQAFPGQGRQNLTPLTRKKLSVYEQRMKSCNIL